MGFSIVQNKKGFSIVGVLVAGGMMGGLAMVLADLTKKQHVAQKVAETGVEITALQGRVVSLLADGEACKKTLEGTAVNPPPAPAPGITGFKNRKGTPVLAVPSPPFNRLVKLNKVELVNIQGSGSTREVDVEITFEKLSKAIKGQKTVKRSVPLTLELDAANTITSCHSPQNYVMKEQLCSEMGGNWNGSNKKCSVPDCSTGQVLTKTATGFTCVAASSLPTCIDGKFIKRVGGIWKCEDPPSTASLPNCQNGKIIKRDGGIWKCVNPPTGGGSGVKVNARTCQSGKVVTGISASGDAVCTAMSSGSSPLGVHENCYPAKFCLCTANHANPSPSSCCPFVCPTGYLKRGGVAGIGIFSDLGGNLTSNTVYNWYCCK